MPFVNNYGVWVDEFKAIGMEHTLELTFPDAQCWFGEGHEVGRSWDARRERGAKERGGSNHTTGRNELVARDWGRGERGGRRCSQCNEGKLQRQGGRPLACSHSGWAWARGIACEGRGR